LTEINRQVGSAGQYEALPEGGAMVTGDDGEDQAEDIEPVRFVPSIGAEGWPSDDALPASVRTGAGESFSRENPR
jgi:hypothetical protein